MLQPVTYPSWAIGRPAAASTIGSATTGAGLAPMVPDPSYRPASNIQTQAMGADTPLKGVVIKGRPLASFIATRQLRAGLPIETDHRLSGLEFHIDRSLRYHRKRRDFLATLHSVSIWVAALSSSGTFAVVLGGADSVVFKILAGIAAAAATFDATFGLSKRSNLHDSLQARFSNLAAKMADATDTSEANLHNWAAEIKTIEKGEPAELRVLHMVCRNEAAISRGYGQDQFYELRWWQSLFAQIMSLPPYRAWAEKAQQASELDHPSAGI